MTFLVTIAITIGVNKKVRNAVMPIVALSTLVLLDSCSEEEVTPEDTPKYNDDMLIGDWQLTEIDGDLYEGDYLTSEQVDEIVSNFQLDHNENWIKNQQQIRVITYY